MRNVLLFLIIFFGCAVPTPKQQPTMDICLNDQDILTRISETADIIHQENNVLVQLRAASMEKPIEFATPIPPGGGPLAEKISIQYTGSLTSATEKIARKLGYGFESTGNEPANPIMVNLDFHNATAFEVLESMGWQAGPLTGLMVDDKRKKIKVIFSGVN
ncbi:hypothetical protein DSCO28_73200 (plasmid) [Desulfosarcina ovata subsp. sediminis]|uniref:Uncharacterized protein n=1 Tax=Desulfosarcina ovata subsp. sediminis TaxID=885957 RepID=A0A5K8A320_9BACT|nr:DotD/TraH family lipoprotein [Desulfosarcina ovata]BBO86754.1 hypothetical protein DSCO28_73200 [Desulfosarcina ovata subsp. sediminis]